MNEKKKEIYNLALEEVKKLQINECQTIFLANMVLGKYRHPLRKMNKVAAVAQQKMPERYRKNFIVVSAEKALDDLESELSESETINEEWLRGEIVSNTVKNLVAIIKEKIN